MKTDEIKSLLKKKLQLEKISVSQNGSHFQIVVIGKIFQNLESLERQKIVYKPLMKYISNNLIHAISIKTYTPIEWENFLRKKN